MVVFAGNMSLLTLAVVTHTVRSLSITLLHHVGHVDGSRGRMMYWRGRVMYLCGRVAGGIAWCCVQRCVINHWYIDWWEGLVLRSVLWLIINVFFFFLTTSEQIKCSRCKSKLFYKFIWIGTTVYRDPVTSCLDHDNISSGQFFLKETIKSNINPLLTIKMQSSQFPIHLKVQIIWKNPLERRITS